MNKGKCDVLFVTIFFMRKLKAVVDPIQFNHAIRRERESKNVNLPRTPTFSDRLCRPTTVD